MTAAVVPDRRSPTPVEPAAAPRAPGVGPPRDAATDRLRILRRVAALAPHYEGGAVPTAHLVDWMRHEGWGRSSGEHDLRLLVRAGVLERSGDPWGQGTVYRVRL